MISLVALLIAWQPPQQPASVVWQFKPGQDMYVEETQRQLLQIKGTSTVTSYVDFTYLWHYQVTKASSSEAYIQATLEKVRINNSTEMGSKASEVLKLQEQTKSNWILTRNSTGWQARSTAETADKHAPPFFLTLGTTNWDQSPPGWKQEWKMPVSNWGTAKILLNVTLKQQTPELVHVNSRAELQWQPEGDKATVTQLQPAKNATLGLGEFDLGKYRWFNFEFYASGSWNITRENVTVQMKQDSYVNYRYHERRPVFP